MVVHPTIRSENRMRTADVRQFRASWKRDCVHEELEIAYGFLYGFVDRNVVLPQFGGGRIGDSFRINGRSQTPVG